MAAASEKTIDVRRAFIDGIRTVLIVDDRMRSYDESDARSAEPAPATEGSDGAQHFRATPPQSQAAQHDQQDDVARALVKNFRRRGWLHDVLNEDFERYGAQRALDCDLVVLDFKLGDEGERCLGILHALASSPQLHLVVLYTAQPQREAWLSVATALAPKPPDVELSEDEEEALDEQDRADQRGPSDQEVVDYLSGKERVPPQAEQDAPRKKRDTIRTERLKRLRVHNHALREHRRADTRRTTLGIRPVTHLESSSDEELRWLRCDNVFVVVVHKPSETITDRETGKATERIVPVEGGVLVDCLEAALNQWKPTFFRRALRFVRHRVAREGLLADAKILKDHLGEKALLVYAQAGGPEEQAERRRQIYDRMLAGVLDRLLMHEELRAAVEAPPSFTEEEERVKVYCRLNWFFNFEEQDPQHLRTGTIFALPPIKDKGEEVGICVSPECDLVPGRKPRPVLWRRATVTRWNGAAKKGKEQFVTALSEAERGHYLFAIWGGNRDGAEEEVLINLRPPDPEEEILINLRPGNPENIPKPDVLYALNGGRIADRCFEAMMIMVDQDGKPQSEPKAQTYRVVGQLRAQVATRLLHETGSVLSRVGVDFVNMPKK
jgi:hypothetical protein